MNFQPISSSSAGNLYIVRDAAADRTLAIECGIRFSAMQQRLKHRVNRLDGVLVSHAHKDHCCALKDILRCTSVGVYALEETFEALGVEHHNAHPVNPFEAFTVAGHWHVMPFNTIHDVPSLGFLIRAGRDKLVYLTDTGYSLYRFRGLTMIAIEANYSLVKLRESDEHPARKLRSLKFHMSIERVLELLAKNDLSKVREIHLLHLSGAHADDEMFEHVVEEATGKPVYVAKDG